MKINIEELRYILKNTPSSQNILLLGKHGIGKSEIITQYYTSIGMKVVPLFLGQMSDPGDIIGLPNKDKETGKTEFLPAYWFPTDGQPIVLFLDELNRARPEILQVVMDLVLNKKLAGKKLPEGSIIVSAINDGDEYTLTDLDPALLSRFNVYEFGPTVKEWLSWGTSTGLNDNVTGFISTHEDYLDFRYDESRDSNEKSYDRRSWKRVSDVLNSMDMTNGNVNTSMLSRLIVGIVGQKAGALFMDYLANDLLVTADDILYRFDSVIPKIKNYGPMAFVNLCDRIIGKIDLMDESEFTTVVQKNLLDYLKYIETKGRENLSYFVSVLSSALYTNFNVYMSQSEELDTYIQKFISTIEV
jgi:hypothetical protein